MSLKNTSLVQQYDGDRTARGYSEDDEDDDENDERVSGGVDERKSDAAASRRQSFRCWPIL